MASAKLTKAKERLENFLKCVHCKVVTRPCFCGPCKHTICGNCLDLLDGHCSVCKASLEGFAEHERVNNIIQELEKLTKLLANTNNKKEQTIQQDEPSDISVLPPVALSTSVCSSKSDLIAPRNLEKRNGKGETPLHVATNHGDFEKVNKLIEFGANVNTKDNAGWTPLHEAALRGSSDIMVLLLENGAVVNEPGMNNITALHDAVKHNCIDTVQILLTRGADINARTDSGLTSLDLAANKPEVLQILKTAVSNPSLAVPPVKRKLVFVTTGLDADQNNRVRKCAEMVSAQVASTVDENTTHLISKCNERKNCPRTLKFMQAVARGKWIVRFDWVLACNKAGKLIDEWFYEVEGCSIHPNNNVPRKARQHAEKQLNPIFNGCHFFFLGDFNEPTKQELVQLSKACGAKVLVRAPTLSTAFNTAFSPFCGTVEESLKLCSHYVFYQKADPVIKHTESKLKTLHVKFLMNSITKFELKLKNAS